MKISSVARKASAIMVAMAALGAVSSSYAQTNSIFPTGWDNNVRDRLFMRLGYTTSFMKTKSEEARDITGPVVTRQQLANAFAEGEAISISCDNDGYTGPDCATYADGLVGTLYGPIGAAATLLAQMDALKMTGLGTPQGIKARAQSSAGTPTISLGYWLDDGFKWLLEAYVLAAPLSVKIYGDGVRQDGTPNSINGRHIATTKLLPPLVIGSYNFGKRNDVIRPYVGLGVMYAIFFDARTTSFFDEYQGGKTTITTKNTFGAGPFAGIQSSINDDWHVNLSVGRVALRTTSTLVTSGTQINTGAAVLSDMPTDIARQITSTGEGIWQRDAPAYFLNGTGFTTTVMNLVKRQRGTADLGTFVREQKMKITNTIVTLSVGRSF